LGVWKVGWVTVFATDDACGGGTSCSVNRRLPRGAGKQQVPPLRHRYRSCSGRNDKGLVVGTSKATDRSVCPTQAKFWRLRPLLLFIPSIAALGRCVAKKHIGAYLSALVPYVVVEMPCQADDGVKRVGIFRLRIASTSWTSCFAQDDRGLT
jgi:hypothetical protein